MALDFEALVLGPCMDAFAKPVTLKPLVSQPGAAAFVARGIWSVKHADMVLDGGGIFSNKTFELGIDLAEFAVPPEQGDQVTIVTDLTLTIPGVLPGTPVTLLVDETRPDGQGGVTLILKRMS